MRPLLVVPGVAASGKTNARAYGEIVVTIRKDAKRGVTYDT